MRVVFTVSKIEPSDEGIYVGGSVNALLSLARAMKLGKRNLELVTCIPKAKMPIFRKHEPAEATYHLLKNGGKPQSLHFALVYFLKSALWAVAKKGSGKVDVIHGHSGYAAYAWITYMLGFVRRVPTVQSIYCPLTPKGRGLKSFLFSSAFARFPLRRMNRIIAMSQNVCDSLVDAGVDRDSIDIIPNGIDTKKYTPVDKGQVRELLGLGSDVKVILFVGNLVASKGLDVLVEAMAKVVKSDSNCMLVVTLELEHEGFRKQWEVLADRAKELGVDGNIKRLGMIDYMPRLMAAADIVVAPYRDTKGPSDYPLALMEAMSSGTCVVGTNVGGIPEIIDDGVTGRLVESEDVPALSQAIIDLLSEPGKMEAMGRAARRVIKEQYSSVIVAEKHINLYRSIISNAED